MTTATPFSYSGSLTSSTRSSTYTLPSPAQSIEFAFSTSQTLGSDAEGGVGTDLTIQGLMLSSYEGNPPTINNFFTILASTFPSLQAGESGDIAYQYEIWTTSPPDSGVGTYSVYEGFPPAGTVLSVGGNVVCSVTTPGLGTNALASCYLSAGGASGTWLNRQIYASDNDTNLNQFDQIVISNDEGINISFSVTGTYYTNSGSGGDTGEVLILDAVSPTYGLSIPLLGNNLGTQASALKVSQDGGTFSTVNSFVPGVNWSGNGAVGLYGTHTLQVEDANTLVQSNIVTYTLVSPLNLPYEGLFQSDVIPSYTDGYTEFGNAMSWTYKTVLLPDNQEMANNAVMRTTLGMQFIGASPVVTASFTDSAGNVLETFTVTPTGGTSEWNGNSVNSQWNLTPWNGQLLPYSPWWLMWPGPVVFKQAFFVATGISATGFKIGNISADYRVLGYTQQTPSGVT